MTSRNQHRVGFGLVSEFSGPFPGYNATIPRDCASFPRVLQENGYLTAAFGKWHLSPDDQTGSTGPFNRRPNALGFDYFWGFLGGEAGQFDPLITENQSTIGVPEARGDKPYYFPDDMAEKAIAWLHAAHAQDDEKPWFVYYSTGCSHAPHHVPQEWSEKYRGKFDQGWDVLREQTFARQRDLGVVPADAELSPRDDAFPAWESLDELSRRLLARQMEVYAGFSENADWNVGRVLDAIEEMGELENTLVIWIWGDNGASLEGTLTGTFNELTSLNGIPLTAEQQLGLVREHGGMKAWGSELMAPHFSCGWAWASNCPFNWGKQVASHLGGTGDPMVVHWPGHIRDAGAVHSHFTHVIDVGPTILDVAGIPQPTTVDGIAQEPMHGFTFADSISDPNAPERNTQQYFEALGNRAMYKDGWWMAQRVPRLPWTMDPETMAALAPGVWNPDEDPVELYYLPVDFAQARNIAEQHPEKVEELQELFWAEAERYEVMPLLGGMTSFFGIVPPRPTQTTFTYYADVTNITPGRIPAIYNQSYTITADLVIPEGGAEGVIVAHADDLGGFSLFVQDGKVKHTYSFLGVQVYTQEAEEALPTGHVTVEMVFAADAPEPATGGQVTLLVNGRPVGAGRMERTVPQRFSGYAGMDIGRDNGLPVNRSYADLSPFAFTGEIRRVVFDIAPDLSDEDAQALHEHAQRALAVYGAHA